MSVFCFCWFSDTKSNFHHLMSVSKSSKPLVYIVAQNLLNLCVLQLFLLLLESIGIFDRRGAYCDMIKLSFWPCLPILIYFVLFIVNVINSHFLKDWAVELSSYVVVCSCNFLGLPFLRTVHQPFILRFYTVFHRKHKRYKKKGPKRV